MEYKNNIAQYYKVTAYFALPAIILGIICEKISSYLQRTFNLSPLVAIVLQLILATLILYIVEIHISSEYGSYWQNITPGLFFVSIYFGSQSSLYTNINNLAQNIGL